MTFREWLDLDQEDSTLARKMICASAEPERIEMALELAYGAGRVRGAAEVRDAVFAAHQRKHAVIQ